MNTSDRNPLRESPGKGDKPRNCHSEKFKKNFDDIDWGKKEKYNIHFVLKTNNHDPNWTKDCNKWRKKK